jgi:hypothetical protein
MGNLIPYLAASTIYGTASPTKHSNDGNIISNSSGQSLGRVRTNNKQQSTGSSTHEQYRLYSCDYCGLLLRCQTVHLAYRSVGYLASRHP